MNDIKNRISDIATRYNPDYPDIKNCDPIEQLWAIECCLDGTNKANAEAHKLINKLRNMLGISVNELIDIWKGINKGE